MPLSEVFIYVIEVVGLRKRYGKVEAVRDVSFSVGSGQVLGLLGPNGAGKTTIMKILTGYHFPDQGTVTIDGYAVQENPVAVKNAIGYLPEIPPLYGDLTVREYLHFIVQGRCIPRPVRNEAIDKALFSCALEPVQSKRIETLSKGYKQRVGLAQAIVHDPPILILDEPTSGLDPAQIIEIRLLIEELGKRKTVILSTHILQEVEAICSQVLILHEGAVAAQGKTDEIGAALKRGDVWDLTVMGSDAPGLEAALSRLRSAEGLGISSLEMKALGGFRYRVGFTLSGEESGELIFDWAVREGLKILLMNRKQLSLEEIFIKLTGEGEGKP